MSTFDNLRQVEPKANRDGQGHARQRHFGIGAIKLTWIQRRRIARIAKAKPYVVQMSPVKTYSGFSNKDQIFLEGFIGKATLNPAPMVIALELPAPL